MPKRNRTGNIKRRADRKPRELRLGYYYIVTDTKKTEKNYLLGLRDSIPDYKRKIAIKVETTDTNSMIKKCKKVNSYEPQKRIPWIVFDKDRVEDFDKIIHEAESEGINVAWSNPCIEIWFSAYFSEMKTCMESTKCYSNFKDVFLKKSGIIYKKNDKNIYSKLTSYGDESEAIRYAKARFKKYNQDCKRCKPSMMDACTTLFHLIEKIRR